MPGHIRAQRRIRGQRLRHGRHAFGRDLTEPLHVAEDGFQVALQPGFLLRYEIQLCQSITGFTRNIGSSFGISVMATILARRTQIHQARLVPHIDNASAPVRQLHASLAAGLHAAGSNVVEASRQAWALIHLAVLRQATVLSYLDAFRLLALLFFAVAPLVWIMHKPRFDRPH